MVRWKILKSVDNSNFNNRCLLLEFELSLKWDLMDKIEIYSFKANFALIAKSGIEIETSEVFIKN